MGLCLRAGHVLAASNGAQQELPTGEARGGSGRGGRAPIQLPSEWNGSTWVTVSCATCTASAGSGIIASGTSELVPVAIITLRLPPLDATAATTHASASAEATRTAGRKIRASRGTRGVTRWWGEPSSRKLGPAARTPATSAHRQLSQRGRYSCSSARRAAVQTGTQPLPSGCERCSSR